MNGQGHYILPRKIHEKYFLHQQLWQPERLVNHCSKKKFANRKLLISDFKITDMFSSYHIIIYQIVQISKSDHVCGRDK